MMNYGAKYRVWIHTRSKCLLSASNLFLNVVPQFMTRASSSSRLSGSWVCLTWNALCFNTVTWEKTGTQLLNKLLLSTLFKTAYNLRSCWRDWYVRGTFLATRPTSYGSTTKKQQHSPANPASEATFLLSKSLEQVRDIQKLAFWRF